MPSEPNYSKYTITELHESLRSIDRVRFPERLKQINDELEFRANENEQDKENHISEMSPTKKNAFVFFLLFSIVVSTLYAEYIQ